MSDMLFFIYNWFFFMVPMSTFMLLNILIITLWTLYLINCLLPFNLALFLEIPPVLTFGARFFVCPHWLSLCVCFYVLNRTAITPSLHGVGLYSRCPVWPSGAVSLISWAGSSRNVPCVGYVGSPITIGSSLILECFWVGTTLRLADHEAQPQPLYASCCTDADKTK